MVVECRWRRGRTLLIDGSALRRGHRCVTLIIGGDCGQTLGRVEYLDASQGLSPNGQAVAPALRCGHVRTFRGASRDRRG